MASNKTPNLNLPQYSGTDLFNLEEVNESYKKIDNSYKEINDNYNKAIQEGSTGNLEVIDARGGHTKLKERLDSIDSSLETNVQQLTDKINEVATTGTTIETVQSKVEEMAEQGLIQAYTIADNTVTRKKLEDTVGEKLDAIVKKSDAVDTI